MRIAAITGDEDTHTPHFCFCSPTEIPLASVQGRNISHDMEFRSDSLGMRRSLEDNTSEGADGGLSVFGVSIFVNDHVGLAIYTPSPAGDSGRARIDFPPRAILNTLRKKTRFCKTEWKLVVSPWEVMAVTNRRSRSEAGWVGDTERRQQKPRILQLWPVMGVLDGNRLGVCIIEMDSLEV